MTFSIGYEMKLDSHLIHNASCQFGADLENLVHCYKHQSSYYSDIWYFLVNKPSGEKLWPAQIRAAACWLPAIWCTLRGAASIWCHGDVTTCRNVTFWPIRPQSLSGFESDNTLGVKCQEEEVGQVFLIVREKYKSLLSVTMINQMAISHSRLIGRQNFLLNMK